MIQRSRFHVLVVLALAIATTGCTGLRKDTSTTEDSSASLLSKLKWPRKKPTDEKPEPYPNPAKLAAVWTPEMLTQTGRVPTRGFGARVFFYNEKSQPVPVEGTLIVHAFNEDSPGDPATGKPPEVKRYEFTPEQFTRHFSQSDLGASYSVWIPWDAAGGLQQRISLVASFKTAEGKLLQGQPTIVMLPGAKNESEAMLAQRFSPQYRKWKEAAEGGKPQTSGLTTTTIRRQPTQLHGIPEQPSLPSTPWNVVKTSKSRSAEITMRPQTDEPKTEAKTVGFQR